jgi:cysteinyl-tRNA synthetase
MIILNSSYRGPLSYSDDIVTQAEKGLERLRSALRPAAGNQDNPEAAAVLSKQVEETHQGFIEAMDDDFNTAGALGKLFDLVRAANQARDAGLSQVALQPAQETLKELSAVLGLRLEKESKKGAEAAPFIDLLIEIRSELRKQKLWQLSDVVRNRLTELGVILEDSKEGTTWRWQ